MNFRVLDGDIYFSEEFIKLHEIREQFLQDAFNCVLNLREEFFNKFKTVEQLLKDGETFGYEYLNAYILKAVEIVKGFGVSEIDDSIFIKNYYLKNYFIWINTLEKIKINKFEGINLNNDDILHVKLNINSELIKKPFELSEKDIELESNNTESDISVEIANNLINSMIESIFNINFAIVDILKDNNIENISIYNNIDQINRSNELIKQLLEDKIPKEKEIDTITEIIKLNPYNENIYKAILYKYGDKDNQLQKLGEFLGYNNIQAYKYKLLDKYYRSLPKDTIDEINESKKLVLEFSNKLFIKNPQGYIEELEKLITNQESLEPKIQNKEIEYDCKMATVTDYKPIRKDKLRINKNMFIIAGVSIISFAAIYLLLALYFNSHFLFRTSINGINVGGKSVKSVEKIMSRKAQEYSLTIEGRNNATEEIVGADIDVSYDFSEDINKILNNQNEFMWIKSIFKKNENNITDGISYDEIKLKQVIGNLDCINESIIQPPVNAYITYSEGEYKIIEEDKGKKVIYDKLYSQILSSIENFNYILNLDDEKCYEEPRYTSESKAVVEAKKIIDKYMESKITYKTADNEIIIDDALINKWINIDDDFNVNINEEAIKDYIDTLGESYDNIGNTRTFTRWSGEVIKVSTSPGIYYIDRDSVANDIIDSIKGGTEVNKELIFKTPNATDEYVINTFVEIDLTNQTIVYYKNGNIITQGNIVTGNVSAGHATPPGVFKLDWKKKDTVLRGDGYASPVSFWMPFNGGIGLHDASWRSVFGGTIYKTNGSHGCVNLPYNVAKDIYYNIEEKTTIICRY